MNRSQYLAAIKATFPGMTARFVEGEFRVSLSVESIKAAYPDASHAEAMARNESLAAYEIDGDSALATARALAASWKAELAGKQLPHSSHVIAGLSADYPGRYCTACGAGVSTITASKPCQPNPGAAAVPQIRVDRCDMSDAALAAEVEREVSAGMESETVSEKPVSIGTVETIDMTPTWAAVVNVFIACLEDGTETGRQAARTELRRMAALADERNAFAGTLAAIKGLVLAPLESRGSDFATVRDVTRLLNGESN